MFFTYNQNNSGGGWDFDPAAGISHFVIIEANSNDEADRLAEEKGLYFDGCRAGRDCSCCGDRWYRQYSDDGTEVPEIYGQKVGDITSTKNMMKALDDDTKVFHWVDGPQGYIHYKNGAIVPCAHPEQD